MTTGASKAERGLIWTAFIFALIAILAIAAAWFGGSLFTANAKNPELGGAAYFMTFGLIGMAFGTFSWIASLVMLLVNIIWNRPALKTILGALTCVFDLVVLIHTGFMAWVIFISST